MIQGPAGQVYAGGKALWNNYDDARMFQGENAGRISRLKRRAYYHLELWTYRMNTGVVSFLQYGDSCICCYSYVCDCVALRDNVPVHLSVDVRRSRQGIIPIFINDSNWYICISSTTFFSAKNFPHNFKSVILHISQHHLVPYSLLYHNLLFPCCPPFPYIFQTCLKL